ncbi:hypothetical protein BJY01DRAFT_8082 [Aspergillus pseudoustus]|uniref:Secreted protein n=1 Tax=Aspergillus pseudoustus TaxID=1810923 RepID=A0ABR4JR55_9EURO
MRQCRRRLKGTNLLLGPIARAAASLVSAAALDDAMIFFAHTFASWCMCMLEPDYKPLSAHALLCSCLLLFKRWRTHKDGAASHRRSCPLSSKRRKGDSPGVVSDVTHLDHLTTCDSACACLGVFRHDELRSTYPESTCHSSDR